jgi:hypothetical protein
MGDLWTTGMTTMTILSLAALLVLLEDQAVEQALQIQSISRVLPDCGKAWPLKGEWNREGEPEEWEYVPEGCDGSTFPLEGLTDCFKGRTLYLFGNSITRQFAFEVPRLLYNMSVVPRTDQKGLCKKIGGEPETCRVELPTPDMTIVHAWLLYLDGRPPEPTADSFWGNWDLDTCGDYDIYNADECFSKLIGEHTVRDVLIFNMGGIYCLSDPVGVPNVMEWRQDLMTRFIRRVRHTFKGQVIYMNVSPVQSKEDMLAFPGRYNEERIERFNEEIVPMVLEKAPDWKIFDVFSLTKPVLYSSLFADSCHFPGHLTRLAWNILGRMICQKDV